jgi:hypothetical protein
MTTTERHDPFEASRDARTHPRQPSCPPHHLRCDWVKGDWDSPLPKQRCRLGDNHTGEHVYE